MFFVSKGYVAVVGFISFAVCYRYGPLVDEKSINILSWTLQLFGLLLVYLGIQIQQVAFAIIVAALFSKNLEYPVLLVVAAWRCVFRILPEGGRRVQLIVHFKQFLLCSVTSCSMRKLCGC